MTERALQRADRVAREAERLLRRHRRERALDPPHQDRRGDDLLARLVGEAPFRDLVRVLGLDLFILDLPAEQEDEVGPDGALLRRDAPRRLLERRLAPAPARAPWSRSIFKTIIAWLSA